MTATESEDTAPRVSPPEPPSRRSRTPLWQRLAILLVVTLGIGMLLYPSAATWLSDVQHHQELSQYATSVDAAPDAAKNALIEAAQDYNSHLPTGVLRDPLAGAAPDGGAAASDYLRQLRMPGRDEMGQLTIPSIHVNLPIFHGTSDAALARGIGHVYGSSLPVGGPGTHAVLAGHSGLPDATMLTDLEKLKKGRIFMVSVLDETLYYRVDDISVVKPQDVDALQIVPGKDYVTLVTCTPIHVNTYRLLVRGVRVRESDVPASQRVAGTGQVGFPWWAAILVLVEGTAAALLLAPVRRRGARRVTA